MKTETLLKMYAEELKENGIGYYSQKRMTIEEILRGRGEVSKMALLIKQLDNKA